MASFCTNCSALLSDDLTKRLLSTTDACLAMLPRLVYYHLQWSYEFDCNFLGYYIAR